MMLLGIVLLAVGVELPSTSNAQSQDSATPQAYSVAEAARRSRQRKKNATRPAQVISNEDLYTEHSRRSPEAADLSPSENSSSTESLSSARLLDTMAAYDAEIAKLKELLAVGTEIMQLKSRIAEMEDLLKWQKRKLALDQDVVYSNPNYTDYQTGQAKLDAEQQQIDDEEQEVDRLKAEAQEKMDYLKAELESSNHAGQ